jgi:hypothetical protein
MTRSEILKDAWNIYRTNTRFINLAHRERLSAAMALAWKNAKFSAKCRHQEFHLTTESEIKVIAEQPEAETKKTVTVKAYVIPMWLMQEKDLYYMGRPNVVKFENIERETAKAFRVYGEWFPKSQCEVKEIAC